MTIDYFYRVVHVAVTIMMMVLILDIWLRYIQIEKKTSDNRNKNSNSLLLFALALILWEYNLFDTDYKYEVFTTIIVNGLLLVATTYFNNGILFYSGTNRYFAVKSVPIISIVLILISNVLINNYPDHLLVGYAMALAYTLFTFVVISIRLLWYYKNRNLIEIGIISCLMFLGLYLTMILSIIYWNNEAMFAWIKIFYLVSTFGLYMVFANLSFNFLQDILNQQYSRVFTGFVVKESKKPKKAEIINAVEPDVNRLIAEDKLEEVVEILLASSNNDNERMTSVLMLANQLSSLNTARLRETIDYNTYRINRNKIVDSLIQLIGNNPSLNTM